MQITEEIKEILARCCASTQVTAKVLFPERFVLPFSRVHDKIFDVLDDDSIQLAAIAAPRGFGKTSCVNLAYPAKKILFREKKFIVPISNTATQAVMQSENLKRELLTNPTITKFFEPIKTDTFSKDMWIASSGTMILPRGSGQQVRGILHGNDRPDLIIVDDLEDAEGVRNEEQRKKLKEWFMADVMNSVNRSRKDWKIVVIGTLLHEGSLLADLLEDDNWFHMILDICDDEYKSNWPEFISDQEVLKLVNQYREQGMLDVFFREYRNKVISTEDANFMQGMFNYYEDFKLDINPYIENVVIVDPAKTVKLHSADSAVIGAGIDVRSHGLYFRRCNAGKMHPEELIDNAINMCVELKSNVLAIEVTGLHEFIIYPIKNEIIRRDLSIQVIELNARAHKDERVAGLVPFYRRGQVWHNKACSTPLEEQLLSFPRSKRWDIMDAWAYIVELLEIGERYFLPKQAEADEADYKQLEQEADEEPTDDFFGDNLLKSGRWRRI